MAGQAKKAKETEAVETKETAKAEQTEKAVSAKVYKFTSANPFLTCAGLGIQFINGVATTDRLAVAKALVKLDGVELVEE